MQTHTGFHFVLCAFVNKFKCKKFDIASYQLYYSKITGKMHHATLLLAYDYC